MRLYEFLKSPRGLRVVMAGCAGAAVLGVGLGADAWSKPDVGPQVRRLIADTHGDFSEKALKGLASGMDPAALAIAQRNDPALKAKAWAATPGWSDYALTGKPNLGFDPTAPEEAQRINAQIPAAGGGVAAARPFQASLDATAKARAVHCLADAVYYEAAMEPRAGQEAVAQVVLNRVRDPDFPNSVCGVVFQGAEQSTGCQFSFTCDGSMARAPQALYWKEAEDVAKRALDGYVATSAGTATHYHADYVMPYWTPTLVKLGKFGKQIFYRWRGPAGDASAFVQRYAGSEPAIDEARFRRAKPGPMRAYRSDARLQLASVSAPERDANGRVHVEIGGSLAGHRIATADDVARINASLQKFEAGLSTPPSGQAVQTTAAAPTAPAPGPDSN
jgi:spore germination cell wall hydrolase CwlJ-like protein